MNCAGCSKSLSPEGKQQKCPTCLKLSLPDSFFCSQECFKASWPIHKLIHIQPKKEVELPPKFEGFAFTGPLRPAIVSPYREVPEHIPKPAYAKTGRDEGEKKARASSVITANSAKEIEIMRSVSKLGREVLDLAAKAVKVGVTTDEIDRIVHEACIERNCYPSPLNYYKFPKSCCTSVNEIICHGIPDSRPLENGDIVNIDVSVFKDGMHSDLNETYFVGDVSSDSIHLVNATKDCLDKAIQSVKPGMLYRDLGNIITKVAHNEGLSVVKTYCGHGVGKYFHCAPNVPHYAKNKAIGMMKPGHIFTIEPMINQGTWKDVTWPDDWTSATQDGQRSAQFEHTLLVTDTGVEILTL